MGIDIRVDKYFRLSLSLSPRLVVGAPRGRNSIAANGSLPLGNVHICDAFTDECPADPRVPQLSFRGKDHGTLVPIEGPLTGEDSC